MSRACLLVMRKNGVNRPGVGAVGLLAMEICARSAATEITEREAAEAISYGVCACAQMEIFPEKADAATKVRK